MHYRTSTASALGIVLTGAFCAALPACESVEQAQKLEDLDQAQYEAFKRRMVIYAGTFARAAIEEEDLTPEACGKIADAIEGLTVGTAVPAGTSLADVLDVDGYGAAALAIVLVEIDAQLTAAGGVSGGVLSQRAAGVLAAVAEELSTISKE